LKKKEEEGKEYYCEKTSMS